jgi:uncharacterized membrane protein
MKRAINIIFFSLLMSVAVSATEFNFAQFDVPGALLTAPSGVNARGQIVGLFVDAKGGHGFLRNTDGTYVPIDVPGAIFTNATSINARGQIVGRWTDSAGTNHSYLRAPDGKFTLFDPVSPCIISDFPTVPHGINDLGDLVGRCFNAGGKELGWLLRHDGTFRILDDPAQSTTDAWLPTNRDLIVGDYSDGSGFVHGYTWTEAEGFVTVDFPGSQTGLRAINGRGDITGIYSTDGFRLHGFLLRKGVFTTVDFPDSDDNGGTLVINDRGLMVGDYIDVNGNEHGFMAIECPDSGCE